MSPLLAFRNVACVRGGRLLWSGIDFALGPGDAMLVTGPNGAGKSSLLRVAAGLLRPFEGGVERTVQPALLAEQHALDPELPLARALGFWAALDGAEPALDAVGLAHLAAVPVRLLSTGQRRRAGLARVVACGAPLWLLDEPASGLDADSVTVLERLVAAHQASGGAALVASHTPLDLPAARMLGL